MDSFLEQIYLKNERIKLQLFFLISFYNQKKTSF